MNHTEYLSKIGRKGGKSKSEAKRRAAVLNAHKATLAKKNIASKHQCSQGNGKPE